MKPTTVSVQQPEKARWTKVVDTISPGKGGYGFGGKTVRHNFAATPGSIVVTSHGGLRNKSRRTPAKTHRAWIVTSSEGKGLLLLVFEETNEYDQFQKDVGAWLDKSPIERVTAVLNQLRDGFDEPRLKQLNADHDAATAAATTDNEAEQGPSEKAREYVRGQERRDLNERQERINGLDESLEVLETHARKNASERQDRAPGDAAKPTETAEAESPGNDGEPDTAGMTRQAGADTPAVEEAVIAERKRRQTVEAANEPYDMGEIPAQPDTITRETARPKSRRRSSRRPPFVTGLSRKDKAIQAGPEAPPDAQPAPWPPVEGPTIRDLIVYKNTMAREAEELLHQVKQIEREIARRGNTA